MFCQTPLVAAEQPPAGAAQTFGVPPPPQVFFPLQAPQAMVAPHPSLMRPQFLP
jgi:hypothetical protein